MCLQLEQILHFVSARSLQTLPGTMTRLVVALSRRRVCCIIFLCAAAMTPSVRVRLVFAWRFLVHILRGLGGVAAGDPAPIYSISAVVSVFVGNKHAMPFVRVQAATHAKSDLHIYDHVRSTLRMQPLHRNTIPESAWRLLMDYAVCEPSFCCLVLPHFADDGRVMLCLKR